MKTEGEMNVNARYDMYDVLLKIIKQKCLYPTEELNGYICFLWNSIFIKKPSLLACNDDFK